MNKIRTLYLCLVLLLLATTIRAQEVKVNNENEVNNSFGTSFIQGVIETDTIETIVNNKIIYNHCDCSIVCFDSVGNIIWNTEINENICNLTSSIYLSDNHLRGGKRHNVIYQVQDNIVIFSA